MATDTTVRVTRHTLTTQKPCDACVGALEAHARGPAGDMRGARRPEPSGARTQGAPRRPHRLEQLRVVPEGPYWVFPALRLGMDPRSGAKWRDHRHGSVLQKAVKAAVQAAGISTPATCHTCRHSCATHLLGDGYDIRTVHARLGYKDVSTTTANTRVLNQDGRGVRSPADRR
jgi:integrase